MSFFSDNMFKAIGDTNAERTALKAEIETLKADNARLRALIKRAEHFGERACCPWCDTFDHRAPCDAFAAVSEPR